MLMLCFALHALVPKMYTVILTAKVNGKKVETRWDFTVDPVATNQ